jgi:hypothetical protein
VNISHRHIHTGENSMCSQILREQNPHKPLVLSETDRKAQKDADNTAVMMTNRIYTLYNVYK